MTTPFLSSPFMPNAGWPRWTPRPLTAPVCGMFIHRGKDDLKDGSRRQLLRCGYVAALWCVDGTPGGESACKLIAENDPLGPGKPSPNGRGCVAVMP